MSRRVSVRAMFRSAAVVGTMFVIPAPGWGADYPSRPLRYIVPFAPGGPTDVAARVIGQKMSEGWSQPVVVDNRPGAGGNIGMALAAKAPPDGYTVLFTSTSVVVNPTLFEKPGFDIFKDLIPVTRANTTPNVIVVHPSMPVKTVAELVALVKANPGKYSYASPGTGTTGHLTCEMLRAATGIDLQHVPFNGAAPATTSLVGNQTPIGCLGLPPAQPQIKSGALRGLAVSSAQRWGATPELPTMVESGYAGFVNDLMTGVFVPAGTPAAIVNRLNAEIARIVMLQDVRDRLGPLGFEPVANSPAAFAQQVRDEVRMYSKVIRDAKIKAD
ncbi:MAG: tripartite tricarboxylate transporter substrate binding protein [Proteobacteria bacterium]|nr:tripartite tricarboxylate transporter substrate binding protein [Burkholderiales bacterium]